MRRYLSSSGRRRRAPGGRRRGAAPSRRCRAGRSRRQPPRAPSVVRRSARVATGIRVDARHHHQLLAYRHSDTHSNRCQRQDKTRRQDETRERKENSIDKRSRQERSTRPEDTTGWSRHWQQSRRTAYFRGCSSSPPGGATRPAGPR